MLVSRLPSVEQVQVHQFRHRGRDDGAEGGAGVTGRPKIAKCEGAYHGSYDYAEVSLDPAPEAWGRNAPVSVAYAKGTPDNVLADVVTIPFNDAEAAVSLIREHGEELACVLVDPMPNRAGLAPADKAYLEALRKVTREVGALLIFDEVITLSPRFSRRAGDLGYRSRSDHARKNHGRRLSGRRDRRPQRNSWRCSIPRSGKPALPHGGTFSANPVTMRAGIAAMELLDEAAFARLDAIGRGGSRRHRRAHSAAMACPAARSGWDRCSKIYFTDRPIRDYRSA